MYKVIIYRVLVLLGFLCTHGCLFFKGAYVYV